VDARELGAALRQSALGRLSGEPGQRPQELWQRLHNQCERAARGQGDDDGFNALTARF
jgi:hypothetical protein